MHRIRRERLPARFGQVHRQPGRDEVGGGRQLVEQGRQVADIGHVDRVRVGIQPAGRALLHVRVVREAADQEGAAVLQLAAAPGPGL